MSWVNSFQPPPIVFDEPYGPEPYDINFLFPLNLEALENERVKLTPFVPRRHMQHLFDIAVAHPELARYLPFTPAKAITDLLLPFELRFRRMPGDCMFIMVDKTRTPEAGSTAAVAASGEEFAGGSYAGIIAYLNSSPENLSTEIGFIVVFPEFQRTHVLSNAVGLMLQYALNLPTESPPGIGLRRVAWTANSRNEASLKAAERMGMRLEGTIRWHWVLPEGKEGAQPRKGDPREANVGRDSVTLSLCWDDWVNGGKEKFQAVMART